MVACIGPKNTEYYIRVFEKFRSGHGAASWNWPAFFMTLPWLIYRKMWGYTVLYWLGVPVGLVFLAVAVSIVVQEEALVGAFYYSSYFLLAFVLVPIVANRLYFGHVNSKIQKVRRKYESPADQLREMHRIGGTSNAAAIIIVALLIIAMIGMLAAIAIPAYQDYTIRAQIAEGLNLSAGAKVAVTEFIQNHSELPTDNRSAGLSPADQIAGLYVSRVAVDAGRIVITYGNDAHAKIERRSVILVPDASNFPAVEWRCYSSDIANDWLPSACRSN
jgi:Tfp pilus assembly major pilin PilA